VGPFFGKPRGWEGPAGYGKLFHPLSGAKLWAGLCCRGPTQAVGSGTAVGSHPHHRQGRTLARPCSGFPRQGGLLAPWQVRGPGSWCKPGRAVR